MPRLDPATVYGRDVNRRRFEVTLLDIDGLTNNKKGALLIRYPQFNDGVFEVQFEDAIVLRVRPRLPDIAKHDIAKIDDKEEKLVLVLHKSVPGEWNRLWNELRRNPVK